MLDSGDALLLKQVQLPLMQQSPVTDKEASSAQPSSLSPENEHTEDVGDGNNLLDRAPTPARGRKGKQYSRKAMPTAEQQDEGARAKWYADMRAHFAKVDTLDRSAIGTPWQSL